MKRVLNVGGGSKDIPLPPFYYGWEHVLLDIDPKHGPDVVCDARELNRLPAAQYDAVYCSHNLEHYYRHDVAKVLAGFQHVLKPAGFVHLRVPDIGELMQLVVKHGLDIDDVAYHAPAGPITVRDVIYGYGVEIETSGNDFYAHKTGFTKRALLSVLRNAGFLHVYIGRGNLELQAFAFTTKPDKETAVLLDLKTLRA